jgi:CheY-like chemotaxis protein
LIIAFVRQELTKHSIILGTGLMSKLLQDKSIFCVEDNGSNRVVFQLIIYTHGGKVQFERWGRDTIARMEEMPSIDLIIVDLMLAANLSGFDTFDEIRAIPKYAHIPIVAVSAMEPSVAIPKVRARGFNGFIAKPIDKDLFPQQLASIIAGEEVWVEGMETK